MSNEYLPERLNKRIADLKSCKTPEELSYNIWTTNLESAMGSSRKGYRDAFVEWVKAYKLKSKPQAWQSYKTPKDLAEGIWNSGLDRDASDKLWFGELRANLIEWIEDYSNQII
jgi:streptogramin lyase